MEIIPIKTKVLKPPKDSLYRELDDLCNSLQEEDILVISSKVVAIDEGNCVRESESDRKKLVQEEADLVIPRDYWPTPLTIKHHAFISGAGVDASNADGYYVSLPKNPFLSAERIVEHVRVKHKLKNIGVVISDSHSIPMRRGAIGISIGYAGFKPVKSLVGSKDLFGRKFKAEVANLVDGIAAAATVAMGEGNQGTPLALVRGIRGIEFTDESQKDSHMIPYTEDTFRVLYERFLK